MLIPIIQPVMAAKQDGIHFWLEGAGKLPLLPKQEMIRLGHIIQDPSNTDKARKRAVDKLVKHNMRMVPLVVRRCLSSKRSFRFGDHFTEDLLQCGVLGLYRAAYKFDPTLGYAFTTYANMWIYQAVQREIYNNLSLIRVPETTIRDIYNHVDKVKGFDFDEVEGDVRHRYIDACRAIFNVSLDSQISDSDINFLDTVACTREEPAARESMDELMTIAKLSDTQRAVVELVYDRGISATSAAKELGISRHHAHKAINLAHAALKPLMTW